MPRKGRAACPQAAAMKFIPLSPARWGQRALPFNFLSNAQGPVGRLVLKPPQGDFVFHLSGALGTTRPTFQFPFERPLAGRAVCPQTAVMKSYFPFSEFPDNAFGDLRTACSKSFLLDPWKRRITSLRFPADGGRWRNGSWPPGIIA